MINALKKTTEAGISKLFSPRGETVSVLVGGLASGESAVIEILNPDTNEFIPYLPAPKFDDKTNVVDIFYSYFTYRVNKGATATEVGVWIAGNVQEIK